MIKNQWYAILPSKAVKKNKMLGVKRLNLDLALFRNTKNELGCVVDQCTHRGAELSKGKIKGDCIRCPFHGLQFDKNGKCMFIPANGKASTVDISRYNVKHYLVKESNGIIYLWYGDEENATGELPFFYDHVDDSYVYSEIEDHWNSHYSRSIENQLDVVHVPIVHYNTIGRGNKTLINGPKVEFENNVLTTSANNEVDEGQTPKPAAECIIKETYLSFMFPNMWMNHISHKVKVIIYFAPVDEENTVLYIRFYCKITNSRIINRIIAFFGKFANRIIERQDKRVVITQKPKASALKSGEKLLSGDGPIIKYRRVSDELKNSDKS
ncbi:Rieske 2Fe-2S domain-containing protein [Acetobacterium paludosum]|uniref:Rieske 2Fe-2S domain-containing protein n=1 Tax=Acetobacterium paludosum TaxID=52693 RepID=A0A923HZP1_9FIRM|nr:aromatic ring-hydroxylating dioxygenase subunit alpha [Acetobacterium paludosum]MBC3888956.1 Rieske 2Fe-2S domain-containing protein [Acetobacterium paludosum]